MAKSSFILAAVAISLMASVALAQIEAGAKPDKIVEQNTQQIHKLVMDSRNDEEMRTKVKGLLTGFVDFEEFGKLALGSHWEKLAAAQQSAYLVEFKELLSRTYLRRFKAGRDFTSQFRGDTKYNKDGTRAEVRTTLTSKDVTADVDYRFHNKGGWKVYDIVVDDVSIMRNYRKSFTKVVERDGFDKLLEKMRKKTTEQFDESGKEEDLD